MAQRLLVGEPAVPGLDDVGFTFLQKQSDRDKQRDETIVGALEDALERERGNGEDTFSERRNREDDESDDDDETDEGLQARGAAMARRLLSKASPPRVTSDDSFGPSGLASSPLPASSSDADDYAAGQGGGAVERLDAQ